jgi:hypothetical protein
MKTITLLALLFAGLAQAADFGPPPTYTSNDPAVTVSYVGANTTTGALTVRVNDVYYDGTVTFVYDYSIGSVSYYHSLPVQMTTAGHTITVTCNATHWVTVSGSGRGGGYRYQHYAVQGGSVTP